MGFYLRKGVKMGPFRLNLSKSGLGLSAGVKGFRVGSGPRGTYVHAGRGGVYYRQTLSTPGGRTRSRGRGASGRRRSSPARSAAELAPEAVPIPADAVPAGGGDVVHTLNAAAEQKPTAAAILVVAVIAGLFFLPYGLILWAVGGVCAWFAHRWDGQRRNASVTYRVEDEPLEWFHGLSEAVLGLRGAGTVRRVYTDSTRHAGTEADPLTIAQMSRRTPVQVHAGTPKHLVTNVAVPQLSCGPNALYFLPDRILARGGKHFGSVRYEQLRCEVGEQIVAEKGTGPPGADTLRTTWEHARKDGGRDRRYKRNRRVTVVRYSTLTLHSTGGLHWGLQCADADAAGRVTEAVRRAPAMPELAG